MNPIIGIAAAVVFLLGLASTTSAAPVPIDGEVRQLLTEQIDVHQLLTAQIEQPVNGVDVDPALLVATGAQEVLVKLKSSPVAEMANSMSQLELMAHKAMVENEQSTFMDRTGTKAKEITCVQTLLNAVFLNIDASEVGAIASDPDVVAIHRVTNYEMMLDETVPYIGATKVQNEGYDGTGVKVAVLDSGIDYTHAAFGGEGTQAAYEAAYKDFTSRDGLFPTEKVIEGFDFVGETWPEGPVTQDNDPIDIFSHGTPVADIIGGKDGVAPGCSLYAVKVCSAVSTRCNGMALIQGMEYAIDPNGDGDTSDAVDIINLSIGSKYGRDFLSLCMNHWFIHSNRLILAICMHTML
jgi:subtilisin family serine protease